MDSSTITPALAASLITIIVTKIWDTLLADRNNKFELRRIYFQRNLEVAESAIAYLATKRDYFEIMCNSMSSWLKLPTDVSLQVFEEAAIEAEQTNEQLQKYLNPIYLYFDFEDINEKYHISFLLKKLADDNAMLSELGARMRCAYENGCSDIASQKLLDEQTVLIKVLLSDLKTCSGYFSSLIKLIRSDFAEYKTLGRCFGFRCKRKAQLSI